MTPHDVIRHFGNAAATARALGLKPPSIWEWVENDNIPIGRQCQIEIVTKGALLADREKVAPNGPDEAA